MAKRYGVYWGGGSIIETHNYQGTKSKKAIPLTKVTLPVEPQFSTEEKRKHRKSWSKRKKMRAWTAVDV